MRLSFGFVALAAAVVLSGCASSRYCLGEQKYQHAENYAPLQPIEGLSLPDSATALRIPPPPEHPVPYGVVGEGGKGICLDRPPGMLNVPDAPREGSQRTV